MPFNKKQLSSRSSKTKNRSPAGVAKQGASRRDCRPPPPPPPSRRPTIAERISMLQMAQRMHKGDFIPTNGIRLVLPQVPQSARVVSSSKPAPQRGARLNQFRFSRRNQSSTASNDDDQQTLTVKLLDSSKVIT